MKKIYKTQSSKETIALGKEFAKAIQKQKNNHGAIVLCFTGDLGAGKTTFIKGFAKELGIAKAITSPTFVIAKFYKTKKTIGKTLIHIDAYRLKDEKDLYTLHFNEMKANKNVILVIEWAELIKKAVPKNSLWLIFSHGSHEHERTIKIKK